MKAVIMAGGEGTRLRPLTCMAPKPMVELLGKPLVQYSIELLKRHGITDIAMTLMYLPDKVREYFGDGNTYGVHLDYYVEHTPLGTAGSVKNAQAFLDETFVLISGDALTDLDITSAVSFHKAQGAKATIVLKPMENPLEYGIVLTDGHLNITRFAEKPNWTEVFSDTVNTGIYILEPELLEFIPEKKNFDFAKHFFPLLMEKGIPISGYVMQDYWCDIGNVEAYLQAGEDILKGAVQVDIEGTNINGLWVQKDVSISNSALIQSPGFIGADTRIDEGARIGQYTIIGSGNKIGPHANIKRTILGRQVSIGQGVKISRGVVGDNSVIGAGTRMFENTVVGKGCVLESGVTLSPRAKVWPEKWIERGTTVNANVIWGFGKKRQFFSLHGIVGEVNAEIHADAIARAGAIFGSSLEAKGKLLMGHDGSGCSNVWARIFAVSAASVGAQVLYTTGCFFPELRWVAERMRVDGIAYVNRLKGQSLNIILGGKNGFPLEERKIAALNQLFDSESYRRAAWEEIQAPMKIEDVRSEYVDSIRQYVSGEDLAPLHVGSTGNAADDFLLHVLEEADVPLTEKTGEALFTLYTDKNANRGQIASGKTRVSGDALDVLAYALAFEVFSPATISLPVGLPGAVKRLAKSYGVEYQEVGGIECDASLYRLFNDFPYFCVLLREMLIRKGETFEQFYAALPPCYTKVQDIKCDWKDIGQVLRILAEEQPEDSTFRGVAFTDQRGRGWISAGGAFPSIRVRTEGLNEEFASELCDQYVRKVKSLLKKERT